MRVGRVLQLSFVVLVGLLMPAVAVGQTGLATVTGIVSDESGAAIPGLTVTATNQATNIVYTGVTNQAGNYIITGVPIGAYVIAAELQGFKGAQSKVTLSAAQTARVDFKLAVGTVEERVEVVATGAVLQTARTRWSATSSSATRSKSCRSRGGACPRSHCMRRGRRSRFPRRSTA